MATSRGRPCTTLDAIGESPESFIEKITKDRVDGFKWVDIASLRGVTTNWLWEFRKNYQFVEPLQKIEDSNELDNFVYDIVADNPDRGETMIMSYIRSEGFNITQLQLRESIRRVDPEGRDKRHSKQTKRRVYWVPGPHHLWHIDGNHKLRRFNIVISAAIDGFSRLCPYIRCSGNNEAVTTLSHFEIGVTRYGCPSRVRTDKGGENVDIAHYMLMNRGMGDRNSVLVGKSTQNQRIERFWRDVYKEILKKYYNIFRYFESQGFDIDDEASMFVLHYLFLNLLNEDLERFRNSWNNHKLRTENGYTPNQLIALNQDVADSIFVDPDTFGVYYENGVDTHADDNDDNDLPRAPMDRIKCPMNEGDYDLFVLEVYPLTLGDRIFEYEQFWNIFVDSYNVYVRLT